ncbi:MULTISPECIES: 2OG-Fe(II) oxygenase [unclassified Variovorax]|jgi:prolyl 4-hydroxylase|uniref:2OG-Fe(II) oxygenase n=1 Tax=unclassified Variovorax TaxID=663243 RepID=UPI00086BB0CB|nr:MULTISPECIES: 2OG-Fe(II) oxygenase [unclassified Variovorax]MBN8755671.1 2OG-Fe(II) oxygenase [Variovorax sp.]ODU19218.1 MAG: proline dioxygenase [Variovorax sp. SCN 67-85]ODV23349.1 MAG: proline dioxygenase [Variovorax sp. SCN 67-20]OJZ15981.1 MAG: proline dioxygenase [Variovorax sp. 67-131]
MSTVVRFSPDLGRWLTHNLNAGRAPQALVATMLGQGMNDRAARAIVSAYVDARQRGAAMPADAIELPDEAPARPVARLAPGTRIPAADREIVVHSRGDDPVFAALGNVVDAEECKAVIEMARPRLKPSTLVDPMSGRDVVSDKRASWGMFFRLGENELIARLDRRLSTLMNLPLENGEGLQLLYYPTGAGSEPHHDYLAPTNAANRESIARSGQRVSTLVTYLNDVPAGGQTVFPELGLAVSPIRGNACYFEYWDDSGRVDARSLHASAPVERGEKWVMTKWMRERRFVAAGEVMRPLPGL